MKDEIYQLFTDLFTDDDGYLYQWGTDGLDTFNSVSQMSPAEVRSFICPTIRIDSARSQLVLSFRFGFQAKRPAAWRNSEKTKLTLERYQATVSISNSNTTSRNLVIAGYLLLKAPMTTHRGRYLQSLRLILPENTPPFDILLHRRTPLDQQINHLVIQCGHRHVHPLSQALLPILNGENSAVYIPRYALSDMTTAAALDLFVTYETYIRDLRTHPLSPVLYNLDSLRVEHDAQGNKIERTTRAWAKTTMSSDGTSSARCDVVNGGYEQKAYLAFPSEHKAAVVKAFEVYRRSLFAF